jgi:catechol 2,3-dioxygenase-like lactoylglutathione lyase family enzyme
MIQTVRLINHLALAVADPSRSLRFYRDTLGVEGSVRQEEYGFVMTIPNGVAFTLFRGTPPEEVGEFHFGLALATSDEVRSIRQRSHELALEEVEWWDEPGYVSMKVRDPDGYIVEIAWDAKHVT